MIDNIIYATLAFFGFVSFVFIVLILSQKRRHRNRLKKLINLEIIYSKNILIKKMQHQNFLQNFF